jgi:hypothetical protein
MVLSIIIARTVAGIVNAALTDFRGASALVD